jgi:hypothetical protein
MKSEQLSFMKHHPFNVVRHPMFIEAMKETFKSQTYYKPPSYHGLHTNLLKQSKVDVSKQVINWMWNTIHKYGTTICSNGLKNVIWGENWDVESFFENSTKMSFGKLIHDMYELNPKARTIVQHIAHILMGLPYN